MPARSLVSLALLAAGCATPAPPTPALVHPIVLASPESGPESQVAAYVRITNPGSADRLVGVRCACAAQSEIHETANRQMHTLEALDVPAGGQFEIRPGGPTHLMLMGLRGPIALDQRVPVTLVFEHAGEVSAEFVAVANSREAWAARTAGE